MRLCRFRIDGKSLIGLYFDSFIVDLKSLYDLYLKETGETIPAASILMDDERLASPLSLLDFLPPKDEGYRLAKALEAFYVKNMDSLRKKPIALNAKEVELLAPIRSPPKFFLLAGNYAEHIEESGGKAEEREHTFPYFFMKPPSTTITDPEKPIRLPAISPNKIDWEVELAVVIGRRVKGIKASEALSAVAGYTIVNDVSDREFRLNPARRKRPNDDFFDWLHGKWHDGFAPMGPCIASPEEIPDPQRLRITLRVNGETMQDSNTGRMVFSVSELIEYLSSFVTLEPGDIISTGTPGGIGAPRGRFLKPGDIVEAEVEGIGILRNPVGLIE
ncbi:MAG: fumarylacetoacetate hydrolase family protein [Candidatus Bathyarchaeia archaeon]